MDITPDVFQKNFKGFQIIDCAVRSKKYIYFSLLEDYTQLSDWEGGEHPESSQLRKRIIVFDRERDDELRWTNIDLEGFDTISTAVSRKPKEQLVGVDAHGIVYVIGSGTDEVEDEIAKALDGGIVRGRITRCRTIDGFVYVTGSGRTAGYRVERSKWASLTQGIPFIFKKDWEKAGFKDIDGFNQSDIYTVGGKGDVWHYDGSKWSQVNFPNNIRLYSICCGADGAVYIGGHGGTVFKGRADKWVQIYHGKMTIPFKHMVWYEDQVWATSDYGLWTIKNDKLKIAIVDDEIRICSGYLSTADGILLVAGYNGAALKENGKWTRLL